MKKLNLTFVSMVDVNITPEFLTETKALSHWGTEYEILTADFRQPALFDGLRDVDASLLYEVLLHQETYVSVMKNVCDSTCKYIYIAQPCIREDFFSLPSGVVLLQFYPDALKDLLKTNSFWGKETESGNGLFDPARWMWGHTTSHLISVMSGFGWKLLSGTAVDGVCGDCWEYSLLAFGRN